MNSHTFVITVAVLSAGCSSSIKEGSDDDSTENVDTVSLYAPLLDNVPPSDCLTNCIWPLRGTEWRLEMLIDDTGSESPVAPETVHTLLFSEVDNRLVGRFDCDILTGKYRYMEDVEATVANKRGALVLETLSYTVAGCELSVDQSTARITQNETVRNILGSDTLMLRDSGNILYLDNTAGETLMYRARSDALDGVIRPFRVIATGDRPGNAYDNITTSWDIIVYDSFEDFQTTTPNLASVYDSDIANFDFSTETLVGLFIAPIEYLGPTIQAELVLERDEHVQVQFHAGTFWCDNGLGLPRGDNAPFELIAIASVVQPVLPDAFSSSACP